MVKRLAHWFAAALAFLLVSRFLPGFRVPNLETALVVSLVYGLLIMLASVLLLPFAYTLFLLVPRPIWRLMCLVLVNSALLLVCQHLVAPFRVRDYATACKAAVLMAVITYVLDHLLGATD